MKFVVHQEIFEIFPSSLAGVNGVKQDPLQASEAPDRRKLQGEDEGRSFMPALEPALCCVNKGQP